MNLLLCCAATYSNDVDRQPKMVAEMCVAASCPPAFLVFDREAHILELYGFAYFVVDKAKILRALVPVLLIAVRQQLFNWIYIAVANLPAEVLQFQVVDHALIDDFQSWTYLSLSKALLDVRVEIPRNDAPVPRPPRPSNEVRPLLQLFQPRLVRQAQEGFGESRKQAPARGSNVAREDVDEGVRGAGDLDASVHAAAIHAEHLPDELVLERDGGTLGDFKLRPRDWGNEGNYTRNQTVRTRSEGK